VTPPQLAWTEVEGDVAGAVAKLPTTSGVGQIVAAERGSLVLGMASNLRRWAASHLGLGRRPSAGRRPKTDLSGIARAIGWLELDGPFRRRLVYERLMAPLVPLARRRDLRPPAFVHLDPGERFPRASVREATDGTPHCFGPFGSRRQAEQAREAAQRRFRLRPCDYAFEPDPALPLGTTCLFAQVGSCAAPCLERLGERDYRALATAATEWLADPRLRVEPDVSPSAARTVTTRALVADAGRAAIGLFPVLAGRVVDAAGLTIAVDAPETELAAALARLAWPAAASGAEDWPWLLAWLRSPRGRASYLLVHDDERETSLAARLVAALRAQRR
jgi:hypothetical protein